MRLIHEPPATNIVFPPPESADEDGIVCAGTDFRPGTLLTAYRAGIFPWPHTIRHKRKVRSSVLTRPSREVLPGARPGTTVEREVVETVVFWFSPDPRALFPLGQEPHWSRTLRRTLRQHDYRITLNQAFEEVMIACGETRPDGTWISPELRAGYMDLHKLGHAHSLEVWSKEETPRLIGGIYGVQVGAVFAGESMFHRETDASKIAFAELVIRLRKGGFRLFDVQVQNSHLESLGCVEVPRADFLHALRAAHGMQAELT